MSWAQGMRIRAWWRRLTAHAALLRLRTRSSKSTTRGFWFGWSSNADSASTGQRSGVSRLVIDKCRCGRPFAYRLGTRGPWYFCWSCDGHMSGCKKKGHPWGRCACIDRKRLSK
jgi:hypothetical protein